MRVDAQRRAARPPVPCCRRETQMAVSVFDLFKIGIGRRARIRSGRCAPRACSRAARSTKACWRESARVDVRAVRLARRHRQGPWQRQGGAARAGRATSPTTVDVDASAGAAAAIRDGRASLLGSARTRRASTSASDLCSIAARRCRSTPTACASARSTQTARAARAAPTTRSAAASSSATRWPPTAAQQKGIAPDTTGAAASVPQRRRAARA